MNNETTKQPEAKQPEAKPAPRIETYRRPFNRHDWEGGRARRTSFSGRWTRDGKFHDID